MIVGITVFGTVRGNDLHIACSENSIKQYLFVDSVKVNNFHVMNDWWCLPFFLSHKLI